MVEVIWAGTWVLFQIPAAPLPPLVTLNKLINLSGLRVLIYQMGDRFDPTGRCCEACERGLHRCSLNVWNLQQPLCRAAGSLKERLSNE